MYAFSLNPKQTWRHGYWTDKVSQWGAGFFEFGTTFLLVQENGLVGKEDMRRIYDVGALYSFA